MLLDLRDGKVVAPHRARQLTRNSEMDIITAWVDATECAPFEDRPTGPHIVECT